MLLMLVNDQYRRNVLQFIKDPIVKNYWGEVFPALNSNKQFATQNLNAPLNKIRRFIANGVVSNIICQKKSTINIAEAINSGGVILARFSRGDMGFENSALLGTMLISKVQIAAMQRVAIPMEMRVPTFLYVDELMVAPLCSDAHRITSLIQGNSVLATLERSEAKVRTILSQSSFTPSNWNEEAGATTSRKAYTQAGGNGRVLFKKQNMI